MTPFILMLSLLFQAAKSSLAERQSSFEELLFTKVSLPPKMFPRYSMPIAVANDGNDILLQLGDQVGGYRLSPGYSLDPDYPKRLVFPTKTRRWAEARYSGVGQIACIGRGLGLAALQLKDGSSEYGVSGDWAVFPLDRRTMPVSTNLIHFPQYVRLVSASLDSRNVLRIRVAEDMGRRLRRVNLVDYIYQLSLPEREAIVSPILVRRAPLARSYLDATKSSGGRYRMNPGSTSWISADSNYAVFSSYQLRISLTNGAMRHFQLSGPNKNGELFYLGNELYRSVATTSLAATRSHSNGSGIWKWEDNRWAFQTELILCAVSPNGRFGVFKRLPVEVNNNPEWILADLMPRNSTGSTLQDDPASDSNASEHVRKTVRISISF